MNQRLFKTKRRLEVAVDNPEHFEGMQDYMDMNFAYLFFDCDCGSSPTWEEAMNGKPFPMPYWIEQYEQSDDMYCQYREGFREKFQFGDVLEIDGERFEYIDCIGLDEEIEHQADDGGFVYEYRGPSFLRILRKIQKEE